jgi:transposase
VRFELTENDRKVLRKIQRQNHKRDYVKATILLMLDLDETPQKIALFLGIDDGTVYRHFENYQTNGLDKFLGNNYFGYAGKLDAAQIINLKKELKEHLYETCQEICDLVEKRFSIKYTAEGMCDLLHRIGFVYKKTKQVAMKVDEVAQVEFIEKFNLLQAAKKPDEVHYFIDAVHPTLNSETSYGWIEKGSTHQLLSNSGRTRMNILGALNPNNITDIFKKEYKTIDSEAAKDFIEELGKRNPSAKKIRIYTDNASYFKKLEKEGLIIDKRIEIIWLPTYAANLNLIERLWRFMKKKVLKNRFYGTAKYFRAKVEEFFTNIKDYKAELETLLTCNFGVITLSQSNS